MERRSLILLLCLFISVITSAQELPASNEQQLENLAATGEEETEDDSYLQELEQFRKDPVRLNLADAGELRQLQLLSDLQIINLISYRSLFGNLLSIYELQAVPGWDIPLIKKLLPFVTVALPLSIKTETVNRLRDGEHTALLTISQVLERSKGFDRASTGTRYLGSPQRVFFRYRYKYRDLLQFGITGDKDAGEQFFRGAQKQGFDFYSFHFFTRKLGIIRSLAMGDFSVSMGQGLIQWQGLAFKKSGDITAIKRQSAVLRPYNSAGEFYFHRGAGITIGKQDWEATFFASLRKIGGNAVTDTTSNEEHISSFLSSGYHRTVNENKKRNNVVQVSFGGNLIWRFKKAHLGLNVIHYHFSLPVEKRNEPYNLYAVSGDSWYDISTDYSYTRRNMHFFGEAAIDKHFNKAFINGILISVDPRADLSLLQRTVSKGFQSIGGNAFTESSAPNNETGYYAGLSIRPAPGWRFDAYADIYKFPWLKYLADAPGGGKDFLVQLTYTPNRQTEITTRYRTETKTSNLPDNITATNFLVALPRRSWRTQISFRITPSISIRQRNEMVWLDRQGKRENGFLSFADIIARPMMKPWSFVLRLLCFETGGYDSRVYAYENDVLYAYSIPAFYDKGHRYSLVINYDINKKLSAWLKWGQTLYPEKEKIGSGTDEINGSHKTEVRVQLKWVF